MTQLDERIGDAWEKHRNGNHGAAITVFEDILANVSKKVDIGSLSNLSATRRAEKLSEVTDSIDAMYGLGLAARADGNDDRSLEIFQEAFELTKMMLIVLGVDDVDTGRNELQSFEDDRFIMMRRMLSQRIEEMQDTEA